MKYRYFTPLVVIASLGLIPGAWGLTDRLLHGLNPTGLGSYVPWGLWVSFYLYFLGLSAGAFLVSILTYLFGMRRFEGIGRLSAFTVLVTLLIEVQFIILDLGTWHRALYQFFLTPSFTSLMTWMFVFFNAMLVVYALKTFFLIREDLIRLANGSKSKIWKALYTILSLGAKSYDDRSRHRDHNRVHRLAMISLPVGLLFYGTNGAFFAILLNRPIWNSGLTPLLFIVAALLSGGALIAFLTYVFRQERSRDRAPICLEEGLCIDLGKVILFLLVVFLFLEGMQFFVGYQTGELNTITSLDLIVSGSTSWLFWIVHLFIGSAIPLYLLLAKRNSPKAITWACFLIFATFAAVRYNFILPDLEVYKLEGLQETFFHTRLRTNYVPTLNEWLVSIWAICTGLLVFLLGTRYLPIVSDQRGGVIYE